MPAIPYVRNPTWADGSGGGTAIDAADLNVIENGIYELSYQPYVRVYQNSTQIVTTATWTALTFNTERSDQVANVASTMHDPAVNPTRLTCRYAGVYLIVANFRFVASTAGNIRQGRIRHQGATVIGEGGTGYNPVANVPIPVLCTTLYPLAVNEYVEVQAYQDTGGNLNVDFQANYSPEFMMVRVA